MTMTIKIENAKPLKILRRALKKDKYSAETTVKGRRGP